MLVLGIKPEPSAGAAVSEVLSCLCSPLFLVFNYVFVCVYVSDVGLYT